MTHPEVPQARCELCENAPAEPNDCFCAPCRVEVLAMLETVNDPVEIMLNRHWKVEPLSNKNSTLCRCGERFDGGPGYHRRHLAEKIYEVLNLDEPMPHTRTALEDS